MYEYYGIDWLAMILTFSGIYFLGNKERKGFIAMMLGNASWILIGILASSMAMIVANVVFIVMYLRGLLKWQKSQEG